MKSFNLILLLITAQIVLKAQCPYPTAGTQLSANKIIAPLTPDGNLFFDLNDSENRTYQYDFGIPGLPNPSLLFAANLWVAGKNASGEVKTFFNSSPLDFTQAGPLDADGLTDLATCENWDRFWNTGSNDINMFLDDWNDGVLDNPVPASLLAWPAIGNPHFTAQNGFDLPDLNQPFAPFEDVNADGIYNPEDGDYPAVKGADQATYYVFHYREPFIPDNTSSKIEFHTLAYAYEDDDPVINSSTYYDIFFFNKGQEDMLDMYFGLWIDPQLGCFTDDYFGCDSLNNMAFIYNEDELDGETGCSCPSGITTFCESIPMVGIKILSGASAGRIIDANGDLQIPLPAQEPDTIVNLGLSSFTYFNNGGMQPPPPVGTDDPGTNEEFYNLLSGKWKDGTPITVGGNGYNAASTDIINYAFPGDPSNGDEWSMCSEELSTIDRRMLMSSGPFYLASKERNTISFAIIHVPNVAHPCPSLDLLQEGANTITDLYENGVMVAVAEVEPLTGQVSVSPNPFSNQTTISLAQPDGVIESIALYSVSGQLISYYENISNNTFTIQKGDLLPGIYFYKLRTKDGVLISGKLVVN